MWYHSWGQVTITKRVFAPESASELPGMLRDAFKEATTGSLGACHVGLPFDVQLQAVALAEIHAVLAIPATHRIVGYPIRTPSGPSPASSSRAAVH